MSYRDVIDTHVPFGAGEGTYSFSEAHLTPIFSVEPR